MMSHSRVSSVMTQVQPKDRKRKIQKVIDGIDAVYQTEIQNEK